MKKRISLEVIVAQNVLTIELDSAAYVKWENRAKAVHVPLSLLLSLFLAQEVQRT